MEDDEREEILYHGTTHDVAQRILAQKKFDERETFFASTRELAAIFAQRSKSKRRSDFQPVVIQVALYQSDLDDWLKNKLVQSIGFDAGDHPDLRSKTQLKFKSEGVRLLNKYMFSDALQVTKAETPV